MIIIEDELHETHTYKSSSLRAQPEHRSTSASIVSRRREGEEGRDVIADGPSTDHGEISAGTQPHDRLA